jgi:hypothetical protein
MRKLKLPRFRSFTLQAILFWADFNVKHPDMYDVDPKEGCDILNKLLGGGVVVLDLNSAMLAALRLFLTSKRYIFFNYDTGLFQADDSGQNTRDAYLFFDTYAFFDTYPLGDTHLEYARKVLTHLVDASIIINENV